MITEKTLDLINGDLQGLQVQSQQMVELARLEDRDEAYLYRNMLKVIERDLDAILLEMDFP